MKTTVGYRVIHRALAVTADISSTYGFTGKPFKTGKTQNKWDQVKSLKIGVWCENFNVHQVFINK